MNIETSIEIMKSLADTSRLRVLNVIMEKPHYVEEISHKLGLAASTVSFHLKKLENARLVTQAKDQYYIIYSINEELFDKSLRELTNFDNIEKYAQDKRIDAYRNKVLKAFFRGKKLTRLPVQRKKRLIVLEEFVKKFNKGRTYTEQEVNEIILEQYDDYCQIRRRMIEEGIMKRNNQIYELVKETAYGE
jgi:predicted transcriptional regulator